jgi:hypothetical protein
VPVNKRSCIAEVLAALEYAAGRWVSFEYDLMR